MRALSPKDDTSAVTALSRTVLLLWTVAVCVRAAISGSAYSSYDASLGLLIQPLWFYRALQGDDTWPPDLLLCLCLDSWQNGTPGLVHPDFYAWLKRTQYEHATIYGVLVLSALFSAAIVYRGDETPKTTTAPSKDKVDEYLLPPLLLPGRTNHARLFPKKHSFSYSYLYVGIPVGWKGRAGSGLSADVDLLPADQRRYGWFHIDSADYLDKGAHTEGLQGKLRHFLHGEGIADSAWSFAYLVTAPRFMGYSFNPVSF